MEIGEYVIIRSMTVSVVNQFPPPLKKTPGFIETKLIRRMGRGGVGVGVRVVSNVQ